MLEDDDEMLDNVKEVTVFPPVNACGDITDEDSGEDDVVQIDNLPGTQLCAAAEVELLVRQTEEEFSSDDDLPLSHFVASNTSEKMKKTQPKKRKIYQWVKEDLIVPNQENVCESEAALGTDPKSPLEYFYQFFDDSIISRIVNETNRYAQQKNRVQTVSDPEIRAFIGVLILSGYVPVPRRKLFWERDRDTHSELVAESITRDTFDYIMSNIHIQDNNVLNPTDKFAKVRPLFQHLNEKFMENGRLEQMHSVDEAMVPYHGRHGTKQFLKGKPIRYGYKLWVGTSRLGYVYWFEPYQGISTNISTTYVEYGVGASVVLEYADALRKKWPETKFHLFFDNFFTSVALVELLTEKGFHGTGTIRENRLPENPLIDSKKLKKEARGSFDFKKIFDQNIISVKWNDNSLVSLCSNYAGIEPVHNVRRYSRKEKQNVQVCGLHNKQFFFIYYFFATDQTTSCGTFVQCQYGRR